jgi:uncharacterized membrane protein YhaH (DUF805 family)
MTFHFSDYTIQVPFLNLVMVSLFAATVVTNVVALVRIVQRTGYSGWWILIMFVPVANMLALWYFGFGPWPADARLARAS